MNLHALCHYRSKSDGWTDDWQSADYAARNIVKALKEKDFNGHSEIKVGARSFHIVNTAAGRAAALEACAEALVLEIKKRGYQSATIVPVPASDHVNPNATFTGRRLGEAITAIAAELVCRPVLYFDQVMPKASEGGTRNAQQIKAHLQWHDLGINEDNIILLDDVCTTGGHLRAARLFLEDRGYNAKAAFVVARTTWSRPESMFRVPAEQLL